MILPIYAQSFLNLLFGFDINFTNSSAISGQRAREYEHLKQLVYFKNWTLKELQDQGIIGGIKPMTIQGLLNNDKFLSSVTFPKYKKDTIIYNFNTISTSGVGPQTISPHIVDENTQKLPHYCGVSARNAQFIVADSLGETSYQSISIGFSQEELEQLYGLPPSVIESATPERLTTFDQMRIDLKANKYPYHTVVEGTPVVNSLNNEKYTPWYIVINNEVWDTLTSNRPGFYFPATRYLALTTSDTQVEVNNNKIDVIAGTEVQYTSDANNTRVQLYKDPFNLEQNILTTSQYSDSIPTISTETETYAGVFTHNQNPIHFPELERNDYSGNATHFSVFQLPQNNGELTQGNFVDINAPFIWGELDGSGIPLVQNRIPTIDTNHLVFGFWEKVENINEEE